MREELHELCEKTLSFLQEKNVGVSTLKKKLSYFGELKIDLKNCRSLSNVIIDVIRPRLTLANIDYLESIFRHFKLKQEPLQHYKKLIEDFCNKMKVEHAYGQSFIEEYQCHVSKLESLTFVLDWEANEHYLKDVRELFKKVFKSYSKKVKVRRMMPGNSIVIECYVPAHLQPVIIAIVQENEKLLKEEKVLSVKAGDITVFNNRPTEMVSANSNLMSMHA